jgi:hypothetical protein
MVISSLASLCHQNSLWLNSFYHTPYFQAFIVEVEARLEEKLIEITAIATSRVSPNGTDILCALAVDALLDQPKQYGVITSGIPSRTVTVTNNDSL